MPSATTIAKAESTIDVLRNMDRPFVRLCSECMLRRMGRRTVTVITVSSKWQIAIPKAIREALNLAAGSKLTIVLRGHEIILSAEPGWKSLRGMARGRDVTAALLEERQKDKQREDLRG